MCVRTGWAATRYHTRDAYYNQPDSQAIDETLGIARMHFPGVDAEAASYLVHERQCVGIGVDTLSPDGGTRRFHPHT